MSEDYYKHLRIIAELKSKIREAENLLNSGGFIAEFLVSLPEAETRKVISRYQEARNQILFAQEQYTDEIEGLKSLLKETLISSGVKSVREEGVSVSLRQRTTYIGSEAERALSDKNLLNEAREAGAISYPPTVNSKKLTKEMKEAVKCATKVSHSITIK